MSLKLEIETWVAALGRYDNNEFDDALGEFNKISDTSKILFNMGVIHATLGEHEKAVECYQRAIRLDQYLAVAYFQQGVSNFLLGDFEEALANFNDTLLYLRGNTMIDYAQLGLLFKLYSCEVLFNRGLCYIYLQQRDAGMQDLSYAVKEKVVEDHNVIDEAIREEAEGYTVFSIPVGVVYRPNDAKVRNLKTKDYLGKARLVAASDRSNAFTGFAGSEIKNAGKGEVKDDRPADNISFAATNLVKPGIQSRRQQSEPPTSRNVFPPTPPPENDRPSRGGSVRNGSRPMPARLTIQTQESSRRYDKAMSPEDIRATRSATSSAPSRGFSRRDPPPMQRRPTRPIEEEDEADPADLYDMYQGGGGGSVSRDSRPSARSRQQPRYIDDEDGSDYDDGSFDGAEFEMVSNNRRGQGSRSGSRAPSRRPEIRKIRVKAHADDVRFIMVGTAIEFPDFVDRIKEKFGMRRRFKIKIKDEDMPEGDMITIGDQDDLEMAIQTSTNMAKRQRQDVAKMEVSLDIRTLELYPGILMKHTQWTERIISIITN
ncbi:NADPH oxidase regulator NoxR [Pochonia chlamydosporia 170]|uniref:NADPH oxidase regulator NoxR n=1 Tax=Pochonia chlamydosporia 170 TaxID=1380566 RepID=A0A179FN37_METCM|nr:NADPH oxidase regulator NoxR [Pochonia chlamydosporia 170]OAQ66708.1 NADPH oxidase regulator NoxR [Pochonia chlamydosporia 170]